MAEVPAFQHGMCLHITVWQCPACRYTSVSKSGVVSHLKRCPEGGGEPLGDFCTLPVLKYGTAPPSPPPVFKATVNSVEAFLKSPNVVLGADLYCPMDDFRAALKSFEMQQGFRSKKYDADFFKGPFGRFELRVARDTLVYRGVTRARDYLFGADLATPQEDDLD